MWFNFFFVCPPHTHHWKLHDLSSKPLALKCSASLGNCMATISGRRKKKRKDNKLSIFFFGCQQIFSPSPTLQNMLIDVTIAQRIDIVLGAHFLLHDHFQAPEKTARFFFVSHFFPSCSLFSFQPTRKRPLPPGRTKKTQRGDWILGNIWTQKKKNFMSTFSSFQKNQVHKLTRQSCPLFCVFMRVRRNLFEKMKEKQIQIQSTITYFPSLMKKRKKKEKG